MAKKRSIKNIVLGRALSSDELSSEKLSVFWGLPIMSSDAVSSVAYAVEEILMALVPMMGFLAVHYVGLVALPIVLLLTFLVFSYAQIIKHYPHGGGAYAVSKENFGRTPSLIAASCLIVDYIMTVAVSVSSATEAVVSAFPPLENHKIIFAISCLAIVTLINLRGATESSKVFGIPTYAFIVAMITMIVVGLFRLFTGSLAPISYASSDVTNLPQSPLSAITLLLFLKAFAAGCTALTGVEAVSNAVPNFKEPSVKTAKHVLYLLAIIIIFVFGGSSILASQLQVVPMTNVTVLSQMANAIFGQNFFFYFLQITTALILLLAANTAFNGLPTLLSILSKDNFMLHQFSQRGTKLSFSNGIIFIFIAASLLLIGYRVDTHRLIPFYAVGVLLSFTFSQAGMFKKWLSEKEKGWQYKSLINGAGAIITLVAFVIVFSMKFVDGAWVLLFVFPLIIFIMHYTNKHYTNFNKKIKAFDYTYDKTKHCSADNIPTILLVHNLNQATLKSLYYGQNMTSDLVALHIDTTPNHTSELKKKWSELGIPIELVVISAPYRDILGPLEEYLKQREKELKEDEQLTLILTKFIGSRLIDALFHNQTQIFIQSRLNRYNDIVTISVPYLYDVDEEKSS